MTTGDLPPSSSVTGTRLALAAFITALPTGVLPVKTRWSKGSAENAAPTSGAARHDGDLLLGEDLAQHLGQEIARCGRELGRLDHGAIAGRDRRGERHEREPDGEVPRRHDADDAERLVDDARACRAEVHLHMPLLRAHPAFEIAAQIVDALNEGHAFEDRGLLGGASLEVGIERLREFRQARPHRILQLEQVGLAGGERRRALAQERGALAGKDVGQRSGRSDWALIDWVLVTWAFMVDLLC